MGGPNQLNSPSPPHDWLERGSKEGITRKKSHMDRPLYLIPTQGKGDKGEPFQANSPIPTPTDSFTNPMKTVIGRTAVSQN
jgi:hypothetical protein